MMGRGWGVTCSQITVLAKTQRVWSEGSLKPLPVCPRARGPCQLEKLLSTGEQAGSAGSCFVPLSPTREQGPGASKARAV